MDMYTAIINELVMSGKETSFKTFNHRSMRQIVRVTIDHLNSNVSLFIASTAKKSTMVMNTVNIKLALGSFSIKGATTRYKINHTNRLWKLYFSLNFVMSFFNIALLLIENIPPVNQ